MEVSGGTKGRYRFSTDSLQICSKMTREDIIKELFE